MLDSQKSKRVTEKHLLLIYCVSVGISEDRLQTEGRGSSEPIDKEKRELNRRTEFIVIE